MAAPKPEPDRPLRLALMHDGLRDAHVGGGFLDAILTVAVFRSLDTALDLTNRTVLSRRSTLHPMDCELGRRALEAGRAGHLNGHAPKSPSAG